MPIDEFVKTRTRKDGTHSWCKGCLRAAAKARYETSPHNQKKASAAWAVANRPKTVAYQKAYSTTNKDKLNIYQKSYKAIRRKTDPKYRLNQNMRGSVWRSLKGEKGGFHWEDIVGYTINDLKHHIEKQFRKGMTWENYGSWHLDHIIPISAFNFSTPDHHDFKRCWALSNLQPLWAKDNIRKRNKLTKHFQPMLAL